MHDIFHFLELLSLISFAISGAGAGIAKRYDIFGIFLIAFATSTGGGMLRDILLGNFPISWMRNSTYSYIIIASTIFAICLQKNIKYLNYTLFIFDSIGLGIFTVLGIEYGLRYGFGPIISILLGTINASFGGILRDILCQEIPIILHKEIYATLSIFGGILFFLLKSIHISQNYLCPITIFTIFVIRIIVVKYKLKLPSIYTI